MKNSCLHLTLSLLPSSYLSFCYFWSICWKVQWLIVRCSLVTYRCVFFFIFVCTTSFLSLVIKLLSFSTSAVRMEHFAFPLGYVHSHTEAPPICTCACAHKRGAATIWARAANRRCLTLTYLRFLGYNHTECQRQRLHPILAYGDAWKLVPDPYPKVTIDQHWPLTLTLSVF